MELIKFKIIPKSSFASFPKGDMIFGHFANHLFLNGNKILENYAKVPSPQIIFSDFLPDGYFPKPSLPLDSFFTKEEQEDLDKKAFKKKNWISLENLQSKNLKECESFSFYQTNTIIRNSLNRLTFTTDKDFTPYPLEEIRFSKQPILYVMFNESFTEESIKNILTKIGKSGFGKKSSIGKGQFEVELDKNFEDFTKKSFEKNYYLTLSPTLLHNQENIIEDEYYYNTFNRFGKYSNSSTPFKKPVLMADSGAVVKLENKKEYIGKAIDNGTNKQSLVQGYSILVPFNFSGEGTNRNV